MPTAIPQLPATEKWLQSETFQYKKPACKAQNDHIQTDSLRLHGQKRTRISSVDDSIHHYDSDIPVFRAKFFA